jgi:Protein of unknown function (DUF3179)
MQAFRGRWLALLLAALFTLASLACFAYPLYVIWPFRHQGATELRSALFVLRIGPWLSVLCAVACLAIVIVAWKQTRRWTRAWAVLFVILAVTGAALARFDLYEQMFHPIRAPQFEAANQARIDAKDFVLAVRVNGASRAYPIREIGYHHIVNDVVGGVPIAATY